ncbi:MAG: NAD(P)/FAD-dependent oxidoreductase [Thermoanaerobaculia bacterium]
MKNLIILGAGTGGTIVAHRMRRKLPSSWRITVVDPAPLHLYQPDLIFLPFGMRSDRRIERPRRKTLPGGVDWQPSAVRLVDTGGREVVLESGDRLRYDLLVVATGSDIHPEETAGLAGPAWGETIHDFYTLQGARRLREALARFQGGRLVLDVVEVPIKCPVAPLEFVCLADEYFSRRGLRDRVEIVYATPLDGAFTRPVASRVLGDLLERKGIRVEASFNASEVDGDRRILRSWDGREIGYDLLVTVPTHKGAAFLGASGLGNELDFVPTDKKTLLARGHDDVFVLGDATDLPTSKAGSVAHFESEVVVENLLRSMAGRSLAEEFDGHANCFVESGWGRAVLIDFNYDVEPLPGVYPIPGLGPMRLLRPSRINHWGKLAFRWIYWNALLPGRPLPVPSRMSMAGKRPPETIIPAHA